VTVAYATSAELQAYLSAATWALIDGDDVDRLLERATEIVDDHVRAAFVVDDDTKLATDTDIAAALSDATCAQVEFWVEVGEEHDIAGMGDRQASIGHLSMEKLPPELAPRALRLLSTAGLMNPVPVTGTLAASAVTTW
jgi:hypothetical protein